MRLRGIAAITALWLVVCGVLAMRHEATTAHIVDGTGVFVHAKALSGNHTGAGSDIHGQRDSEGDTGECALLTGFHQAASAAVARPTVACASCAVGSHEVKRSPLTPASSDVYRLAPKTSPPVAG